MLSEELSPKYMIQLFPCHRWNIGSINYSKTISATEVFTLKKWLLLWHIQEKNESVVKYQVKDLSVFFFSLEQVL